MDQPKHVFTRQEELRKWWEGVKSDERFDKVITHAIAQWNVGCHSPEMKHQWDGVQSFIAVLDTLGNPPQNTAPKGTAELIRTPRVSV